MDTLAPHARADQSTEAATDESPITCPACQGHGTLTPDRAGIVEQGAQILHRAILNAMHEASATQLRARAARLRDAIRPRPGDTSGCDTTPAETVARRRRAEAKAIAMEQKAAVLDGPDAVIALAHRLGLIEPTTNSATTREAAA